MLCIRRSTYEIALNKSGRSNLCYFSMYYNFVFKYNSECYAVQYVFFFNEWQQITKVKWIKYTIVACCMKFGLFYCEKKTIAWCRAVCKNSFFLIHSSILILCLLTYLTYLFFVQYFPKYILIFSITVTFFYMEELK